MSADAILFVLGLLLLGIPSPLLCSTEVRGRLQNPARRKEDGIGSLARSWVNWADLVRGAAGAWLVQRIFVSPPGVQDDLAMVHLASEIAVLGLGAALQIVWVSRPPRIVGPAFFLTGFTLVVSGPLVGAFALVLGFACSLMIKRLSLLFILVPAGLLSFGVLFHEMGVLGLFNAAVFAAPAFFAFAFGQRLAFVRRPSERRSSREYDLGSYTEGVKMEEKVVHPDFGAIPEEPKVKAAEPDGMMFDYDAGSGLTPVPH